MFDFFSESYYEYYYSPSSTRNSKIIAFVFSLPFLIMLGSDFWNLINQVLIIHLGANDLNTPLTWIICLVVLGLLILLKNFIDNVIHDMAFVETYHVNKPRLKGDLCLLSVIFISMALALSALAFSVFPKDYEYLDLMSLDEVIPGKIYCAEDLEVWYSYAGTRAMDNEFYVSIFYDKDKNICVIPFDAGGNLKLLDELDDMNKVHIISCYVRFSQIEGKLSEFYRDFLRKNNWLKRYKVYYLNAEYICAEDENFMLHAITNREILRVVVSLILIFTGIYTLKEAFVGIYKPNNKKIQRLTNKNSVDIGKGDVIREDLLNDYQELQELVDEFDDLIEEFDDEEDNEDNKEEGASHEEL